MVTPRKPPSGYCRQCGKPLTARNRSGYCQAHRHLSASRRAYTEPYLRANAKQYQQNQDGKQHAYLRRTWANMWTRLENPNSRSYKDYGARGITCHWQRTDYKDFEKWILGNLGERPEGMTLDRIDVDGDYAPGNLRWATAKTQASNRRQYKIKSLHYPDMAAPVCAR